MSTTRRDFAPGIHHVWVSATGDERYFRDHIDRMTWIRELVDSVQRWDWTCLAFCQMSTHVHLLLEVPDYSLPTALQRLNSRYGRRYNARHDREGQVLRRRYGNRRIQSGDDLLGAFAYVVLNPVKAGICPRAEDWRWSSYATTLQLASDYGFVDARLLLAEVEGSTERLRLFVEAQQGLLGHVPASDARTWPFRAPARP